MIGFFDSGFGGLTVLKETLKKNAKYDYLYLGDSARSPYGTRSEELIYEYTREAVDFLMRQGCQLVIIACSSASARALRKIQQNWLPQNYPDRKVLGVIIPVAEATVETKNSQIPRKKEKKNKVGIIGTRATINSGTYEKELKKLDPGLEIYSQTAPLLVPLAEEGWLRRPETKKILKYYLRPLKEKRVDFLILGCTHYPVLASRISEVMGPQCRIIIPGEEVAKKLTEYLDKHPEIEKKLSANKKRTFYTTDDPQKFQQLGPRFLGENISRVEKISLN